MRVLIIDDDPQVARALGRALARHDVVVETDGIRALTLAQAQSFDVVLCDVHMPAISGPELLSRLDPTRCGLRILMSGESDATGSWPILTKPFSLRELWATIESAMAARCA
jgi:DNA-binding response OmpR family regulator